MWKVIAAQPSHSSCFLVSLSWMVVLLFFVATLPTASHCLPLSSMGGGGGGLVGGHIPSSSSVSSPSADLTTGVDLAQFQNLFREALKYIQKISNSNMNKPNVAPPPPPVETTKISGQVNLRYPRSELGDVAIRLWNLQEMDRKYGAKARPRFGKRNEVTQDNFIPMYGDEELKDSTVGANGDGYPVVPPLPLVFIP